MLKRALGILIAAVALPYAAAPVYRFPEPVEFSGEHFLNPYHGLRFNWQRANFHAHGRAWGGMTSGEQSSGDVADTYRSLGYNVPGVSNYHSIAAFDGVDTLPIYEHGFNINKRHQLAIGAQRVEWFDLLLFQSLSQQQFILDRVGRSAELVALSHPLTRNAYDADAMRYLTGYDLIEVINGGHTSEVSWDAALSSGHAVWALANDDTHDLTDPQRTAMSWNLIDAPSASPAEIFAALRRGRSVAVTRNGKTVSPADPQLTAVGFEAGRLSVAVSGEPSKFVFIGQDGAVRKVAEQATQASYQFRPDDTYIRAVVRSTNLTLLLNPVIRYDGSAPPLQLAIVDKTRTWIYRGAWVAAAAVGVMLYALRRRRRDHITAGRGRLRRSA
jgi:hypothetical protein